MVGWALRLRRTEGAAAVDADGLSGGGEEQRSHGARLICKITKDVFARGILKFIFHKIP
jgi:hypothetical protein